MAGPKTGRSTENGWRPSGLRAAIRNGRPRSPTTSLWRWRGPRSRVSPPGTRGSTSLQSARPRAPRGGPLQTRRGAAWPPRTLRVPGPGPGRADSRAHSGQKALPAPPNAWHPRPVRSRCRGCQPWTAVAVGNPKEPGSTEPQDRPWHPSIPLTQGHFRHLTSHFRRCLRRAFNLSLVAERVWARRGEEGKKAEEKDEEEEKEEEVDKEDRRNRRRM